MLPLRRQVAATSYCSSLFVLGTLLPDVRLRVVNLLDCLMTVFADLPFSLVPLRIGEQLGELRREQGELKEALVACPERQAILRDHSIDRHAYCSPRRLERVRLNCTGQTQELSEFIGRFFVPGRKRNLAGLLLINLSRKGSVRDVASLQLHVKGKDHTNHASRNIRFRYERDSS